MKDFLNYLNLKRIVPEKKTRFYLIWVSKSLESLNGKPVKQAEDKDINRFINNLSKNYPQWQVD